MCAWYVSQIRLTSVSLFGFSGTCFAWSSINRNRFLRRDSTLTMNSPATTAQSIRHTYQYWFCFPVVASPCVRQASFWYRLSDFFTALLPTYISLVMVPLFAEFSLHASCYFLLLYHFFDTLFYFWGLCATASHDEQDFLIVLFGCRSHCSCYSSYSLVLCNGFTTLISTWSTINYCFLPLLQVYF